MQHAVLLGRDSWMRFNPRSYRALPPRPHDNRFFGELTLSHHATTGVSAYAIDPITADGGFHLLYDMHCRGYLVGRASTARGQLDAQ